MVVGRDEDADIRIVDPRISRAHLILRFEQGKWLAIDNGSVNGTFVNGRRVRVALRRTAHGTPRCTAKTYSGNSSRGYVG